MILASCRRDFDSNRRFGDLRLRDYPRLSDLRTFTALDEAQLADAADDRHVLVLVHGYRNPIRNVATAYATIERTLLRLGRQSEDQYDLVIGYLWPGFETALGFFPAVPFANRAASYLRRLLQLLNSHAHTVDVQTHSLGARVALQAMAFEREVWIDNLMLTAPAVDNESIEPAREFHQSLRSCRRCFVYHSSRDRVLRLGYRIGSFDSALGHNGPEHPAVIETACPNVFVVDCSAVVSAHGGYRLAPAVYAHWGEVLADTPLDRFTRLAAT